MMIKTTFAFCLLFSLASISCSSQKNQDLSNTKWIYDFGACKDYYEFMSDNKYQFYSCESGNTFSGTYNLKGDTIIVKQLSGMYDKNFSEDSRHRAPKLKIKMIITDNQLHPVERWEYKNEKWIKSNFTFDEDYFFGKAEK